VQRTDSTIRRIHGLVVFRGIGTVMCGGVFVFSASSRTV
jgi:hypothetical protein